jgi:hypothetical protein
VDGTVLRWKFSEGGGGGGMGWIRLRFSPARDTTFCRISQGGLRRFVMLGNGQLNCHAWSVLWGTRSLFVFRPRSRTVFTNQFLRRSTTEIPRVYFVNLFRYYELRHFFSHTCTLARIRPFKLFRLVYSPHPSPNSDNHVPPPRL